MAEIQLARGQNEEVISAARRAIAIDPSRDYPYWLTGQALFRLSRLDEAIEFYRDASQRAPDNFINAMSLAEALFQAEQWDEAKEAYLVADRAKSGDALVQQRLSELQSKPATRSDPPPTVPQIPSISTADRE